MLEMASDGDACPAPGLTRVPQVMGSLRAWQLLPRAGEEKVTGCCCWLSTGCWRVLRAVLLCLGLQSPVVISANCNYLLPRGGGGSNRLFPEKLLFVLPAPVPGRKSALPGKGD